MILFPDLPVFKHAKSCIPDIAINNGLHYGGIALTPPISRFQGFLDDYFRENQEHYVTEKLARIHVKAITHDPGYVVDYLAKMIKRGRVDYNDLVFFPKSVSELPDRNPSGHE